MTRNRSGCWTQDPARIFYNMCFIRKARRINETILVSSPPPNADRTTDLSTNGFIQVMILARVLFFSSRSYLGLCFTGKVSELLLVSKEDRDPLGKGGRRSAPSRTLGKWFTAASFVGRSDTCLSICADCLEFLLDLALPVLDGFLSQCGTLCEVLRRIWLQVVV